MVKRILSRLRKHKFIISIVFLVFFISVFYFINSAENDLQPIPPPSTGTVPNANVQVRKIQDDNILHYGSFYEPFYSSVAINKEKTTLYEDMLSTALYFPLDYDWKIATTSEVTSSVKKYFDDIRLNPFKGPYEDKRCIGQNCLEIKGIDVFYKGVPLEAPTPLSADIIAVSIGSLKNRFLIGYTLREGPIYKGAVYYFSNGKFTEIVTPTPIESPYYGLFGFGGEENDFLVVFGSYKAIGYRIRGTEVTDISKFFTYRTMGDGFRPEIVKTGVGKSSNWYIYSHNLDQAVLIKMWQNGSPEIIGAAVISGLFSDKETLIGLKAIREGREPSFIVKLLKGQEEKWHIFTDKGFKNSVDGYLTTNEFFHNGNKSELAIKKVAQVELDLDEPSREKVDILFSEDGENWRDIPRKKDAEFISSKIKSFYIKLIFEREKDKFSSPYLDYVIFDYYCQNR